MKKSLKGMAVLLACMAGYAVCPGAALATMGPMAAKIDSHGCAYDGGAIFLGAGYLSGDFGYQGDYTVFSTKPGEKIEGFKGVSYNAKKNVLTLKNVKTTDYLFVHEMGDDFKIKVSGRNRVGQVLIQDAGSYSTSVKFTGKGSLTVNKKRFYDSAISVDYGANAKLVVGAGVKMKLYSGKRSYLTGNRSVVRVSGTKLASASKAIQFRGLSRRSKMVSAKSGDGYTHELVASSFKLG